MRNVFFKQKKLSLLLGLLLSTSTVSANPQGAAVVQGQATISSLANTLTVTNSPNAIINWQSFNINSNETTQFIQQSSTSRVLNRVTGQDPSQIMGQLISNGQVYLINPNGIVFGANAIVDTAGLIASTLNLSNQDFLQESLKFEGSSDHGDIDNQGFITAGENGDIILIAPNIKNSGVIETYKGQLLLAAGEKITITSLDANHLSFEVQSAEHTVTNLGDIITHGGAVSIFAGSLSHSGSINADTVGIDEAGNIILSATNNIDLQHASVMSANGLNGGKITVESLNGDTVVRGDIEANGQTGNGGHIRLLGERVGLFGDATISANGDVAGGEVLIGGDFQGNNEKISNASHSSVSEQAVIEAQAVTKGDGGKVIVWADGYTVFSGTINASAGELAGDGGFVEVSGKESLNYTGSIDVSAQFGVNGQILFDPKNITITSGGADPVASNDQFTENSSGTSNISSASLESALNSGDVTLQASNDISVDNLIGTTNTVANKLTLQAGRTISINENIDTKGGDFLAVANSSITDGVVDAERDAGAAQIILAAAKTIDTGGGTLGLEISDGAGLSNNTAGNIILNDGSVLDSDGGNIKLIARTSTLEVGATAAGASILTRDSVGTDAGDIGFQVADIDIQSGSSISAADTNAGDVVITPFATNRDVVIDTGSSGTELSVSAAELQRITAATITVGRETDTGTLTVSDNLDSTFINASTLNLKHQNIELDNPIDLSNEAETIMLQASNSVTLNKDLDAGLVDINAPNVTFASGDTNVDSIVSGGEPPLSVTLDSNGTTLFRNSVTLNDLSQSDGLLDTMGASVVTINGSYSWLGGDILGTVTANSTTTVSVSDVNLDGTFNNNGTFNWRNGTTINGGAGSTFNNNASAVFNVTLDSNETFNSNFNNAGTLNKASGTGTSEFTKAFINTGTVNAEAGLLKFDVYTQTAGLTKLSGGSIENIAAATNFNGGRLQGAGTFKSTNLNINAATLSPGNSIGSLTIDGNLNLASTSTVLFELAGLVQGSSYDFINVTQNVLLDGLLSVALINGFVGVSDQQFNLIQSQNNTILGNFSTVSLPSAFSFTHGIDSTGGIYQLTGPVAAVGAFEQIAAQVGSTELANVIYEQTLSAANSEVLNIEQNAAESSLNSFSSDLVGENELEVNDNGLMCS